MHTAGAMTSACRPLACGLVGLLLAGAVSAAAPLTRDDVWGATAVTAELLLDEPWTAEPAEEGPPVGSAEAEQREERRQIISSLRCRGCHTFSDKEMAQMDALAQRKHRRAKENGKICLQCHFPTDICCH
jgi:hypothetical protein